MSVDWIPGHDQTTLVSADARRNRIPRLACMFASAVDLDHEADFDVRVRLQAGSRGSPVLTVPRLFGQEIALFGCHMVQQPPFAKTARIFGKLLSISRSNKLQQKFTLEKMLDTMEKLSCAYSSFNRTGFVAIMAEAAFPADPKKRLELVNEVLQA